VQVAAADCRDLSPLTEPVSFVVDQDAEPGNALPVLAALLIDLARRQEPKDVNHQ
jgi:hypothetical protein